MNRSPLSRQDSTAGEFDPRILRRLHQFVSACSLLAVALGLWVLMGWILHSQIVKSILPGQVAVKANTAACFILIGLALWILRREDSPIAFAWNLAAKTAAVIASIIGLISFLEFLGGWDLGIDQLLFTAGVDDIPGSVRPGLMSPLAASGFFGLGLALLMLESKSKATRWSAQLLPFGVAIAGMFGILDFVEPQTTRVHISPATALVLFLLAFGVLFARTRWGLGALIARVTLGGTLTRRLLPASILIPLAIGWLPWKGQSAGLYSERTGLAMMTVLTVVLLASLTAWTGFTVDGGERKGRHSQEILARLAAIVTSSNDAIFSKSLEGIVTSWNPGAELIYGYSAGEMIGQSISVSIPPDHRQDYAVIMDRVARGEPVEHYETPRLRKDGQIIQVSLSVSPVRDEAGRVVGASTIARDITERKKAQKELRESQEQFRVFFDEMLMGFALLEPIYDETGKPCDFRYLEANPAFETHCGISRDRVMGKTLREVLPSLESVWFETYGKVAVTGESIHFERYAEPFDRWLELTAFRICKDQVAVTFADISERKRASAALRESEEGFQAMANGLPQLAWMAEPDGHIFWYNQRWYEYTGTTFEQMEGWGWESVLDPEVLPKVLAAWKGAIATGQPFDMEFPLRGADGVFRVFLTRVQPLKDSEGRVLRWFGTNTDVSEREAAEQEIRKLNRELEERVQQRTEQLRQSEHRVRRKLESILSPEGDLASLELSDILDIPAIQALMESFHSVVHGVTALLDLHGNVLSAVGWQDICVKFHRANPESCENCRQSDRELSKGVVPGEFKLYKCKNNLWDVATPIMLGGQHMGNLFCGQFFLADETIDYEVFRAQARQYGFNEREYIAALERIPRLTRKEVNASMTFLAKMAQMISQLSYSSIKLARSMTETNRANQDLAASVKELEAFTYSVSHDLRAPLRHISGFSQILTEEFGSTLPTEAQRHLQRIQDGTRRMGQLVDDLLNLAGVGRRDLSLRGSGLKLVVDEVIAELAPEYVNRQIEWKIGDLPFVQCDPGLMKQVFQNLISNALKFTRPRPQAVIEIGQTDEPGSPILFVRDNGVGFNMKYAAKLFGVFQRLHRAEDFEGTGVGLATVQRIIQKHGGRIWAEAELDKGATFYFTLGASEEFKAQAAVAGEKV